MVTSAKKKKKKKKKTKQKGNIDNISPAQGLSARRIKQILTVPFMDLLIACKTDLETCLGQLVKPNQRRKKIENTNHFIFSMSTHLINKIHFDKQNVLASGSNIYINNERHIYLQIRALFV